ncbi:hypothetical protein F0562_000821 [Nyssa sinensis]|uniref:Uncharacterized protein n=1 Tax=Nyssa sinensis TaxID=561372 RepID=A0A5J5C5J8_9ASTE|nr:hypothetical protein F0562_000821 [Nyssa sinensis]
MVIRPRQLGPAARTEVLRSRYRVAVDAEDGRCCDADQLRWRSTSHDGERPNQLHFVDKTWIDDKTEEELEDLEDDPDLDGDRFLQEYRKKRLTEMEKQPNQLHRFG